MTSTPEFAPRWVAANLVSDVSVGSYSEVSRRNNDFRFTPETRHPAGGLGCPFSAMNGNHRPAGGLGCPFSAMNGNHRAARRDRPEQQKAATGLRKIKASCHRGDSLHEHITERWSPEDAVPVLCAGHVLTSIFPGPASYFAAVACTAPLVIIPFSRAVHLFDGVPDDR